MRFNLDLIYILDQLFERMKNMARSVKEVSDSVAGLNSKVDALLEAFKNAKFPSAEEQAALDATFDASEAEGAKVDAALTPVT